MVLVVVALVMVLEVVVWKTVCWTPSGRAAPVLRGTPSAPVVQTLLLLLAATVCIASVSNLKPLGSPLVLQIVLLRLFLFLVRSTMFESNCGENMETNK